MTKELKASAEGGSAPSGESLKLKAGFSTLEMLIAFTVLIPSITGVMLVVFGNQSVPVDTQTNNEALYKGQQRIEDARATSRNDFPSIISDSLNDGIYLKSLSIADLTQCRKHVTSTVTWTTGTPRQQKIEVSTELGDVAGAQALGGDCDVSPPIGGWTNPQTLMSRDLNYHASYGDVSSVDSSGGNQGTGVDVVNKMIYMTAGVSAPVSKDDFFVLDGTNVLSGVMPPIAGSLDTGPGLNALDVARDNATGKTYAYVVQNDNQYQFQVIDVSNPANPILVASTTLPNITFTCSPAASPCLAGQSIFYYDGRVYIGTNYIANLALPPAKNNEFHVFCVSNPSIPGCSPATPVWMGSANVNHNINAIMVRGRYAYLATSDGAGELTILDVSDPAAIPNPGMKFDAPGSEDGESLYLIGNKLYLGRDKTASTRKDFYILDISNPAAIVELGSKNLGLNSSAYVAGVQVSSKFSFLAIYDPNDGFQVLDISNPVAISRISTFNFSQKTRDIDYEDGFIYTANENNDALRIIRSAQCADKIDDDSDGKIDIADPQCHTDGDADNPASYDPEDDNES